MKQITKSGPSGFQKVVFDEITAHYPGGVHVDKTSASTRFTDGVLPAGAQRMQPLHLLTFGVLCLRYFSQMSR